MIWRFTAIAVLIATTAARTYAQPAGADFKQTPEWKALNRYVGAWDNQAITTVPERKQSRHTPAATWILGDRFVQMKETAADAEAMYLLTYDQNRRAVRFWMFSSSGQTSTATGSWDQTTSTLTLQVDDLPPGSSGTFTDRFTDDDHHQWQWVFKDAGGKVVFEVSGKATRIKNAPEKPLAEQGAAARGTAAQAQLASLSIAIDTFEVDCGRYPTEDEGLRALRVNPGVNGWAGPYLKDDNGLVDPWGNKIRYSCPDGKAYRLACAGPDGMFGTADDIRKE